MSEITTERLLEKWAEFLNERWGTTYTGLGILFNGAEELVFRALLSSRDAGRQQAERMLRDQKEIARLTAERDEAREERGFVGGCIWEDCDQGAVYCVGHAEEYADFRPDAPSKSLRARIAELEAERALALPGDGSEARLKSSWYCYECRDTHSAVEHPDGTITGMCPETHPPADLEDEPIAEDIARHLEKRSPKCSTCGGEGEVMDGSINPAEGGVVYTFEPCPDCSGGDR